MIDLARLLGDDGWTLEHSVFSDRTYVRHHTAIVLRGLNGDSFRADSYVRLLGRTDLRANELLTGYTGLEPTPAAFFSIRVRAEGFDVEEQVGDEVTKRTSSRPYSCPSVPVLYRLVSSRSEAVVAEKMGSPQA
ncbi:hypothetical protein D7X30_15445 [Corallococcus sp. AB011P]|nr:hypothetical protein D7X30_15445 [Corallococcus sp. AB011P]